MKKFSFAIVALLACVAIAGSGAGCRTTYAADEYLVRNVIDGDTVILSSGKHVRYIGIDTPETRKKIGSSWQYAPEKYAEEAKNYNWNLVYARKVRLEFDDEKEDKYGRWLAYVYVDGIMVNTELLR